MVYLGWFCGAIIFGMISDSFGRKTSLLLSIGLMSAAGVASSFVNIFWLFASLKILVGAGIGKLAIQILDPLKILENRYIDLKWVSLVYLEFIRQQNIYWQDMFFFC